MGANIWFWLIYVIVGVFGMWGIGAGPFRPISGQQGPVAMANGAT